LKKKEIINLFNLKKEEIKNLDTFVFKITKTNSRINLVGKSTLVNPWERHMCDCLQISKIIKNKNSTILDMGTGAGLPGLVLTILGYKKVIMVESKNKKSKFVEGIINELSLKSKIINARLEDLKLKPFDFIVSRALTSLDGLLNYSLLFSNQSTTLVFLKGRNVNKEIIEAKKYFFFDYTIIKSKSSNDGNIIKINNFMKK